MHYQNGRHDAMQYNLVYPAISEQKADGQVLNGLRIGDCVRILVIDIGVLDKQGFTAFTL